MRGAKTHHVCVCGEMKVMCGAVATGVLVILGIEVLHLGVILYGGDRYLGGPIVFRFSADTQLVKGTTLRGRAATDYKQRVQCFSESGRWVFNDTPRWIPPNIVGGSYEQCDKRWLNATPGGVTGEDANRAAANGSHWNVRMDLRWVWQTNETCPLFPFDREDFCRLVGANRNLLIVGDSLNQEVFYVMLNYLLKNTTGIKLPLSNFRSFSLRFKVCQDIVGVDGFDIGFVRNDRLSLTQKWEKCMRNSSGFQEFPWISFMDEWKVSILVLNRGAHYENNGNYTEHLINTLYIIQARYPSTIVFYRSTPHGHPNCSNYDAPLSESLPPETMTHNWEKFALQNELARTIVESFGHTFIDFAAIVNKRPDAHVGGVDCLHYCLPGPLDIFAPLFYNSLLPVLRVNRQSWY